MTVELRFLSHVGVSVTYDMLFVSRGGMTSANQRAGMRIYFAPMAALTRGMTSVAINSIERLARTGSTQSMPA